MEPTVNLLAKHFRRVLANCSNSNWTKIRLRADLITVPVYFSKASSQLTLWQNNGGVCISWEKRWDFTPGPHEAVFVMECPREIDLLDKRCQDATEIVVVFIPPLWKLHEEQLVRIYGRKSPRLRRAAADRLLRVRALVESAPEFTPSSLRRLLDARPQAKVPLSCAPLLRAGAAHVGGTDRGAL